MLTLGLLAKSSFFSSRPVQYSFEEFAVFEILSTLRQQAKELRVLANDVGRMPRDWQRTIDGTQLLGEGIPVEAWYLADHFLVTWADWHVVRWRYDRYFGTGGELSPRWWSELDHRCQQLAAALGEEEELERLMAASWRLEMQSLDAGASPRMVSRDVPEGVPDGLADDEAAEADALTRQAMTGHERSLLVSMLGGQRQRVAPVASAAWEQNRQVIAAFDRASPRARAEIIWQLRNYRHATLDLSWLREESEQDHRPPTALERVLADDEATAGWAETLVDPIMHALGREGDREVLRRIVRAVSEIGYDTFSTMPFRPKWRVASIHHWARATFWSFPDRGPATQPRLSLLWRAGAGAERR